MSDYADAEQFEAVIARFSELMQEDEEIAERCEGINVSMGFEISDPDVAFHAEFNDGAITGALGEADSAPAVSLEMSSETFDGMMRGKINPAAAAMTGRITISGDMSAALSLQTLGDDMNRLYEIAKRDVLGS